MRPIQDTVFGSSWQKFVLEDPNIQGQCTVNLHGSVCVKQNSICTFFFSTVGSTAPVFKQNWTMPPFSNSCVNNTNFPPLQRFFLAWLKSCEREGSSSYQNSRAIVTLFWTAGLQMTHGLRVLDALEPKFTPFKCVLCMELTL